MSADRTRSLIRSTVALAALTVACQAPAALAQAAHRGASEQQTSAASSDASASVQSSTILAASATPQPAPPPPPSNAPLATTRASDGASAPVFGSQLFSGAFAAARPTKSSDYLIQPGDQIAVRIYGAINVDSVQTVDTSGDLFIQGIGPVQVGGAPASQLQSRLTSALRGTYTDAVGVYVDVLQGGTVGVYLAGDVARPGRYLGTPNDSVLYYLDRAGGIDADRGSFRAVEVRRNGQTVATFDLYDFMTEGRINAFPFHDGDVIYVARRGPMVVVTGSATNAYAFEARPGQSEISGAELMALARPSRNATSVGVSATRDGVARAAYYPLDQFTTISLGGGDHVNLTSDVYTETISVTIDGDIRGPSIFVMPRGAMLSQLLQQLPLEGSDVEPTYVHIERASIAAEQKAALNRALDNLERAALTQPTYSAEGASIAANQASLVSQFVARARAVQPDGKVAVYTDGQFHDIRLLAGDKIILPPRSDVVIVAGEVLSPGAFAWGENLTVRQYIDRAGGWAPNADHRRYALRRPDGSAQVVNGGTRPRPGDQIVVVPGFPNRGFQLFKDITQIAFQIATSTAAVLVALDR